MEMVDVSETGVRDPLNSSAAGIKGKFLLYALLVSVIVGLFAAGTLQDARSLSLDSAVYLQIGSGVLDGGVPYRDYWDHKPPALYWTNALALQLLPEVPGTIHIWEWLWDLAIAGAFFVLARRVLGSAWGALATLALALFLPSLPLTSGGNTPEAYLVLPVVAGYAFLFALLQRLQVGQSPRLWPWTLVIGGLFTVAALFKPPAALHLVVAAASLTLAVRAGGLHAGRRTLLFSALGLMGGLGLVLLPVAAYFHSQQALPALIEQVLVYNSAYVRSRGFDNSLLYLATTLAALWPQLQVLFLFSLLPALAAVLAQRKLSITLLVLHAWAVVELTLFGLGGRFYPHHFIPVVPVLVLLASVGVQTLGCLNGAGNARPRFALRAFCLYAAVLLALNVLRAEAVAVRRVARLVGAGTLLAPTTQDAVETRLVAQIERLSTPHSSLFIWGARPELYYLSGRQPASRFLYVFPLLNSFGGLTAEGYPPFPHLFDARPLLRLWRNDLERRPPLIILVEPRFAHDLVRVPVFAEYLQERYTLAATQDQWQIYVAAPKPSVIAR